MKMRWLAGLAGWVASVTAGSLLCAASTGEVHVSSGQDAEKGVLFIRVLNSNGQMIASGSGFLVDDHGSLVTCLSVIQPRGAAVAAAETISVNGRITPVKGLLALDESLDLALVQLTEMPEGCTALSLDTSTRSRIGEIVCAVGHPQGFRMVSTTGAVNAAYTTRELPPSLRSCECMLAAEEVLWLETSARVGYGHAGAPLVDAIHGRVLGVVESKVLQSGTNLVLHAAALPGFLAQPRALVGLAEASAPEAEVVRLVNGFNYAFSRYQNARSPHSDIFFHLARTEIPPHPALTQVPQLLRLAESNRGGRVEYRALEALLMAASTKDCPLRLTSEVQQASARMLELYRDDRRLRWMLQRLPMPQLPSVRDFLRELAAKSSREDTKVFATLALARTLEDERGKADAAAEALRLAQSVKDCDPGLMFGSEFARTVARDIAERLGAISIGAPAPALVGTDASGQPLDLKEMKGRYVAVVFWTKSGDFFDTAQATMSKVMSDYAGAPLAVLGVRLNDERMGSTSYSSFPAPKVETDEERMRVLTDTRDNQIRRAWHVRAVPAAFLIDREGHIAGHFVNESSNPRATVTDRAVFANSSDMKPGRWADDLIAAMESTPAISEGRHELLAIVTNGPWIATGNWDPSSPGDRTVFFQPNGKASANWIEEWHVHTPNILHLKLWRDGWAKVKVNADTGEGILTGRTNVTARVLRRREMTVPAGESELARKTRETLRAGPWSWFEHGNPGREASSLTLNFASNGTFNVVQFRAWEVLSNGQVRIYRSNGAYWTFDVDVTGKVARSNFAESQLKEKKAFAAGAAAKRMTLDLDGVSPVCSGAFSNSPAWQTVDWEPAMARYICIEALNSQTNDPWTSICEVEVFGSTPPTDPPGTILSARDEVKALDRKGWSVLFADSEEFSGENGSASNVLDGWPTTFWHTQWLYAKPAHPHRIVIDMGREERISGLRLLPRRDYGNGRIKDFRIYISTHRFPMK